MHNSLRWNFLAEFPRTFIIFRSNSEKCCALFLNEIMHKAVANNSGNYSDENNSELKSSNLLWNNSNLNYVFSVNTGKITFPSLEQLYGILTQTEF